MYSCGVPPEYEPKRTIHTIKPPKGCLAFLIPPIAAAGVCVIETDGLLSDISVLEPGLAVTDQTFEPPFIPAGLNTCSFEHAIAEEFLPVMETGRNEHLTEGEYAEAHQITPMTRSEVEDYFRTQVEMSDNPHFVAMFIFAFVEDNGAKTANFVINDYLSITITEEAFRDLNSVLREDIEYSHPGDLERVAFLLEELTIEQAIEQGIWQGPRPEEDGFVYVPKRFFAKRHNNGWEGYPPEMLRLLDNHALLIKTDKNALFISEQDTQNSGVKRISIGPVTVDISGDIPRSGKLIYWNLPQPTGNDPCPHNVGEFDDQRLPFAYSAEKLHPTLKNIDLWDARPFGNRRSSARLIRK